jgi:GNAT superfamily N-acetyltransferase
MIQLVRLSELNAADALLADIEAIFFGSAVTTDFSSGEECAAYRELWLGRYMRHCAEAFFVALDGEGAVAGYLAGSLVSARPPLSGPDYYSAFPQPLLGAYPAHLHVNIRKASRGQAIGSKLVDAFRRFCRARTSPGFHAVTAADSDAARFFRKCGLLPRAEVTWRDRRIVMLGEALGSEAERPMI